jgi:hypothetical protein
MAEPTVVIDGSSFPLLPCPAVDTPIGRSVKVVPSEISPFKAIARKGFAVSGPTTADDALAMETPSSEASWIEISPQ